MSDSTIHIPDFDLNQTPDSKPLVKWGWLRALIFVGVLILLAVIITPILGFLGFEKKIADPILKDTVGLLITFLVLFLAIFICRKFIDKQPLSTLGINFNLKEFLLGSLFGIVLMSFGSGLIGLAGWGSYAFQGFDPAGLFKYFLMFVMVAIFEEWLVRTYLLHSFMASMNKYLALVLTSLLFGLLHAGNPDFGVMAFIEISLAGILLGLWYIHRGNIWFPVGIHLTWNYFQGPIFGHEVSGNAIKESLLIQKDLAEPFYSGGKFGVEGSIIGVVVTILGCLLLELYLRKKDASLLS